MKSLQVLLLSMSAMVGFSGVQAAENISYLPQRSSTADINGISDIEELVNAGISQDVLMAFVQTSPVAYNLSSHDILRLQNDGVTDAVIVAMLDHGTALRSGTSASPSITDTPFATPSDTTIPVSYDNTPDVVQAPSSDATVPAPSDMNVSFFYQALSPDGTWHQDSSYGWVWQPNVETTQSDWRPYAQNGHWTYTDQGWYFQSDYNWSWAAFHYGRWTRTPELSWVWVPGTDWAPSWVTWRKTSDSYGWAPLPPEARYDAGIGFRFNGRDVNVDCGFGLGHDDFNFVRSDRFLDHDIGHALLPRENVTNIYNNSVTINNTYVYNNGTIINNGIPSANVAAATHQTVRPIRINDQSFVSGQKIPHELDRNGTISAFRPTIAPRTTVTPDVLAQRRQDRIATASAKAAEKAQTKATAAAAAHDRVQQEIAKRTAAAADRRAQTQAKVDANRVAQTQKKQDAAVAQQQKVEQHTATQQAAQAKVEAQRQATQAKATEQKAQREQQAQQQQQARAAQTAAAQQKIEAQRQATQAKAAEQKAQRDQQAQQNQQARAAQTAAAQQKVEAQRQATQAKAAEEKAQRDQQAQQNQQARAAQTAAAQQKVEAQRQATQAKAAEEKAQREQQAQQNQQARAAQTAATQQKLEAQRQANQAKAAEQKAQRTQKQEEARAAQAAKQQERAAARDDKKGV